MPAPYNIVPPQDIYCTNYSLAPNGIDLNLFACNQCAQGYIWTAVFKCVKTQDTDGFLFSINLGTGGFYRLVGLNEWCFAHVMLGPSMTMVCAISRAQANTDPYTGPIPTKVTSVANNCNDWNDATQTCASADNCLAGVYEKNAKVCTTALTTCLPNCKQADGGAWC